jgi:hypothetical protein
VEKGGLRDAVAEAGIRDGEAVPFADELRLGLHGRTRRVLAPRGVKVVQPVQVQYEWRYLFLAVVPRTGELRWAWMERMRQEELKPILAGWELRCVVWDGAPSHKGKQLAQLGTTRLALPSYSPELNPAERVFEEIRARVEGKVYASLAAPPHEAASSERRCERKRTRIVSIQSLSLGGVTGNGGALSTREMSKDSRPIRVSQARGRLAQGEALQPSMRPPEGK